MMSLLSINNYDLVIMVAPFESHHIEGHQKQKYHSVSFFDEMEGQPLWPTEKLF